METPNQRCCEVCNISIHRASYAKHLRSKSHSENEKVIPSNFFNEATTSRQSTRVPSLKDSAKQTINISGKTLEKGMAERILNPYYFSQRYEPQH